MWLYLLIPSIVLVVFFLIFVFSQSNTFSVSRAVRMACSPDKPFAAISDPKLVRQWNPWVELDPNLKETFEGAAKGVGSIYSWDGDKNVGAGRQTIVSSKPNESVEMKLEFFRPFAGTNQVTFTFVKEGNETIVTWGMTGKRPFMMKAMRLVLNMEKMCGDGFTKGLNKLKTIVEKQST